MEFTQLRSFVEVARYGHLTRAAERLHLSQPAISAKVKRLEEVLGTPLFHRSSTGMALTTAGRALMPYAEAVLAQVDELRNAANALSGKVAERLRLGTVLDGSVLRIGQLLRRAIAEYPHVEIELHQTVSHVALASVRAGDLDASFYFGPDPGPDLRGVALREIDYQVAFPAAWSNELKGAPWEVLVNKPWIVTPEGSSHRQLVLQLCADLGARPARMIEADSEQLIADLVESGLGLSLIRAEFAKRSIKDKRIGVWAGAAPQTVLWLVYAPERSNTPVIEALLKVLAEVWPSPAPSGKAVRERTVTETSA